MKLQKLLRTLVFVTMLSGVVSLTSSCEKDTTDGQGPLGYGTVSGIVTDDQGAPLADVNVTVTSTDKVTAKTDAQGKYTLTNVPIIKSNILFAKEDYQGVGVTITPKSFAGEPMASVANAIMQYAAAQITGLVTDAKNNGVPLAGVTVSVSASKSVVTGSDGRYLIEQLPLADYTISFVKNGYASVNRPIKMSQFNSEGVATFDLRMGGKELLRGLTAEDLAGADKWYANEFRGGKGNGGNERDWSGVYMSTLNFTGAWENQNEGCTLQIRNSTDEQKNPVDMDVFDSFVYGSKLITADNKIMAVMARTHAASAEAPCYFGVQVIDLKDSEPTAKLVGDIRTHGGDGYEDYYFDLSEYVGKEVIVAIGTFRYKTGDYWKQLPIRHISFSAEPNLADNFLPGKEVAGLEGWHMTEQMVRSTMTQLGSTFTGVTPSGVDVSRDNRDGYRGWRGLGHIGAEWAFMYVSKDVEPTAGEGFVIKTRGGAAQDLDKPESYFYSKYAVEQGRNQFTLTCRNMDGGKFTFFKITAITEDGVVKFLSPKSNTAAQAMDAGSGCWKFIHNQGSPSDPTKYASFVYDLSEFNGRNVMLTIGVHKGDQADGEQKLSIYGANIN